MSDLVIAIRSFRLQMIRHAPQQSTSLSYIVISTRYASARENDER